MAVRSARLLYGQSAIMMVAGSGDVVRALVAAGAKDINKKNFIGETAIMRSYNPDVTHALLEGGAAPLDCQQSLQKCIRGSQRDLRVGQPRG